MFVEYHRNIRPTTYEKYTNVESHYCGIKNTNTFTQIKKSVKLKPFNLIYERNYLAVQLLIDTINTLIDN